MKTIIKTRQQELMKRLEKLEINNSILMDNLESLKKNNKKQNKILIDLEAYFVSVLKRLEDLEFIEKEETIHIQPPHEEIKELAMVGDDFNLHDDISIIKCVIDFLVDNYKTSLVN